MPDVIWPDGFERTPPADREPYPHGFRVDRVQAFENILEQLRLLEAGKVMVDSGAPHRTDNPNIPYEDATPDDPGVVVYFVKGDSDYAVPCDRWDNIRDNAQAIARYLEAKRALERYSVQTIESEFRTQQLPSGRDPEGDELGDRPPHEVLGVSRNADPDAVEAAARELKKEYHPDHGGSYEQFKRVLQAEEAMLD